MTFLVSRLDVKTKEMTWGANYTYVDYQNPPGQIDLNYSNVPEHKGYSISNRRYYSSRATREITTRPYINWYDNPDNLFAMVKPTNEEPIYLWLEELSSGGRITLDFSYAKKLKVKKVTIPENTTNYYVTIDGYLEKGVYNNGRYRLGTYNNIDTTNSVINLHYSDSTFSGFRVSASFKEPNDPFYTYWYHSSYGEIPASFKKMNADFEFVSTTFDNFSISTQGALDGVASTWAVGDFQWSVLGPANKLSYKLPQLSPLLKDKFAEINRDCVLKFV